MVRSCKRIDFHKRLSAFHCQRFITYVAAHSLFVGPFLNKYHSRVLLIMAGIRWTVGTYLKKKIVGRRDEFLNFVSVSLVGEKPKKLDQRVSIETSFSCFFNVPVVNLKNLYMEVQSPWPFQVKHSQTAGKVPSKHVPFWRNLFGSFRFSTWQRWWKIMLFLISMMELGLKHTKTTSHLALIDRNVFDGNVLMPCC